LVGPSALVIGNLEGVTSAEGCPFNYANLHVSSDLAWLTDGLDLAVIGNNHISDFGPNGVNDTLRAFPQRGILSVGFEANIKNAIRPQIVKVGRKKLGIISLCCPTTHGENLATHWTEGVPPLGMALLCDAVRAGKQQCDALLVFLQWGCEDVHDALPDQLRLAQRAIAAGADEVVGCHSQTIQSYECYKGHWIFYGRK
jgi:poly-gamma-glutamate capsule biosynthesis protein CapA/YwtB (metallophosphatase superfamily)